MLFRTPLANVKGLGSAKDGTNHWIWQRITAVAMIPLSIWFLASLLSLAGQPVAALAEWLNSPLVAIALVAFLGAMSYHIYVGMRVVIEDYIHTKGCEIAMLLTVKFVCILGFLLSVLAIVKLHLLGLN